MLPFSKRPPPPEEYFLRSGDFEAMRQDNVQIPSAPRAPVFARHSAQTPYGFVQPQQQGPWQNTNLSAPPPPHSLAPMAMSERGMAITGTNRSVVSTVSASGVDKPSLKWGVMIALTGALLGGVLGLGMDARRQAARAAAAAEAKDAAPAVALQGVAANQLAAPVAPAVAAAPIAVAPVVTTPAAPVAAVNPAPAAVVIPPQAAVVVPPATAAANKHARTFTGRPSHPSGGSIAMKVNRPAPEPKADPVVKNDPAPVAQPKAAAPKKDVSAAQQVLEAANKDTVNTL